MTVTSTNLLRQVRQLAAAQAFQQWTDHQLLERFAAERDEAVFALLVRRHGAMVFALCRRILGHEQDAEDAFQAVFLLLARKAGSIRQKDVGGWLYRVAHRLSIRNRVQTVKRHRREQSETAISATNPSDEASWKEMRQVVDEEMQRLPDDLRSALVLCYLEGKTQEEAARLLEWSKATLRRRLDKGRELLRCRLISRGLAPMAALTATLFAEGGASASVPSALMEATVQTALARDIAPAIAALAEAGGAMLSLSKAKLTTVILLATTLLGGTGLWLSVKPQAFISPAEEPRAVKTTETPKIVLPKATAAKTMEIAGRVFGSDGKPKVGAKLFLLGYKEKKIADLGVSAANGRFAVAIPKRAWDYYLIAQADDAGIDFVNIRQLKSAKSVELRLVKDHILRGRVVNTEGKPIRGVRVAVNHLGVFAQNSLDAFLIGWKERDRYLSSIPWWGEKTILAKEGLPLRTTTDANGSFTLHGAGVECIVTLHLSGAGIAEEELRVVNREGFDPKPYNQATRRNISKGFDLTPKWMLHGPNATIVADAEKPIRGIVKDADTGKGRSNTTVHLTRSSGGQFLPLQLHATTDARGRYEIRGAHKAKSYMLEVEADSAAGYMPCQVWAGDTAGYASLEVDIRVKKGVVLTGKVIDASTGELLPGFALAGPLVNNPFVKAYPQLNSSGLGRLDYTGEDGFFRIVTTPGPVLLMGGLAYGRMPGGLVEMMKYKPVIPDPKYPHFFTKLPGGLTGYVSFEDRSAIVEGNFCKVLHIKPGAGVVKQDIVLERASALTVNIQDAEGQSLTGVWAKGISSERWLNAVRIEKGFCSVYHLEAGNPRLMVFYHPERKLAASLTLKGDENAPITVKLEPAGKIVGRLFDSVDKPLIGTVVEIDYRDREASDVHEVVHKAKQVVTEANGAFAFEGLIPQKKFFVQAIRRGKRLAEEGSKPREPIVHEVKPGECRDLGLLKMKPLDE
jgi:RNA polymerase sigma factor (sigma-70 family)